MAMDMYQNNHDVRFACMISPGYTTDFGDEAKLWILDRAIPYINKMFLSAIHDVKAPEVVMKLQNCTDLREWIEIAAELSGYGSVERYREHCCPGYPWPYFNALTNAQVAKFKYF